MFQASPKGHMNKAMMPDRCLLLLLLLLLAGVVLDDVELELDDGGGTEGRDGGCIELLLELSPVVFVGSPS